MQSLASNIRARPDLRPLMINQSIAAFPMYDFPHLEDPHAQLWSSIRDHLITAGVADAPQHLTRGLQPEKSWAHPALLLGQACEYPLAKLFANSIRVVAHPKYRVKGCLEASYRSAVLVRRDDSARTLSDLKHRRCVINDPTSNSGMNLLRAAVAPLAKGKPFFSRVLASGSHRNSLEMVAGNAADVLAVDCVTWAHLQRLDPSIAAELRILTWTSPTPSLPFITAANTDDSVLRTLRMALAEFVADERSRSARDALFIEGFDLCPTGGFSEVMKLEYLATRAGYPQLL